MFGKSFIKRMLISSALLFLGMLVIPFLLQLTVSKTDPASELTAAIITDMWLKPLFLLVILSMFMLQIGKRLRRLDMSLGWLVFVLMSFAASWEFLFSFGYLWGRNASLGVLPANVPYSLILFFGFILFVSALPDKKEKRPPELSMNVAWILARIYAVHLAIELVPENLLAFRSMIINPLIVIGLKPPLVEWLNYAAVFISTQVLTLIPSVFRSSSFLIFGLVCCAVIVMERRDDVDGSRWRIGEAFQGGAGRQRPTNQDGSRHRLSKQEGHQKAVRFGRRPPRL